jgi:ornithine cyclodeaminase
MNTLLLKRSDIVRLIDSAVLIPVMRSAFRDYSPQREIPGKRFFTPLGGAGDAMILTPGLAAGIPAYSIKVHAHFWHSR